MISGCRTPFDDAWYTRPDTWRGKKLIRNKLLGSQIDQVYQVSLLFYSFFQI